MPTKTWTVTVAPSGSERTSSIVDKDEMYAVVAEAMYGRLMGQAVRAATRRR
jgi:hypothetical protein